MVVSFGGRPRQKSVPGFQDLSSERFGIGQVGQIACCEDLGRHVAHRVVHDGVVFFAAKDDPDRIVFARLHQMFFDIGQIQTHLAGVGVGERANLEIDHDKALEPAVEQQRI